MENEYRNINLEATGKRMEELLKASGISAIDLAKRLGVSNQAVYKWLKGKSLPTLDNMYQISQICKVPIDDIIVAGVKYSYYVPECYVRETVFRCFAQ